MKEKGYIVARRTIAKYREQLDIPVARMTKRTVIPIKYKKSNQSLIGLSSKGIEPVRN